MFIAFICACVAAANMAKVRSIADAQASQVASFAAVWTALLMILFSIGGTVAMMKRVSDSVLSSYAISSD